MEVTDRKREREKRWRRKRERQTEREKEREREMIEKELREKEKDRDRDLDLDRFRNLPHGKTKFSAIFDADNGTAAVKNETTGKTYDMKSTPSADGAKYTDKDGIERYATGVKCTVMKMLGSRNEGQQTSSPAASNQTVNDLEDDIPFN